MLKAFHSIINNTMRSRAASQLAVASILVIGIILSLCSIWNSTEYRVSIVCQEGC